MREVTFLLIAFLFACSPKSDDCLAAKQFIQRYKENLVKKYQTSHSYFEKIDILSDIELLNAFLLSYSENSGFIPELKELNHFTNSLETGIKNGEEAVIGMPKVDLESPCIELYKVVNKNTILSSMYLTQVRLSFCYKQLGEKQLESDALFKAGQLHLEMTGKSCSQDQAAQKDSKKEQFGYEYMEDLDRKGVF